MMRVFKHAISELGTFAVEGKIVHVDVQHGNATAWFETGSLRKYVALFTGDPVPVNASHVGTAVGVRGGLVIHVYEFVSAPASEADAFAALRKIRDGWNADDEGSCRYCPMQPEGHEPECPYVIASAVLAQIEGEVS